MIEIERNTPIKKKKKKKLKGTPQPLELVYKKVH